MLFEIFPHSKYASQGGIHGSDDHSYDHPSDLLRLWTYP